MNKDIIESIIKTELKDYIDFATTLAKGEHKTLSPPFISYSNSDIDILDFYHQFFTEYINCLKRIDRNVIDKVNITMQMFINRFNNQTVKFDIIHETIDLCNAILEATTQYFKGFPNVAYEKLEYIFIENSSHLLQLLPQLTCKNIQLYRARKGKDLQERKELFHTPFELRTKCASYRFSTLGYPSLYLASSLETALLEVGAKNPLEYFCSCFKTNNDICVVDLALPNRDLTFWEQYSLLVFYPLIVACNLKVKNTDDPFKPEYVIPQLLTQIIRLHSSDIIGISYTSTKHKQVDYTDFRQRNFVIYVPYADSSKEYSKDLSKLLYSTKPIQCNISANETIKDLENKCSHLELGEII